MSYAEFAEAVAQYCRLTGASVTSWWRTPSRNRQVGGVPHSAHLVGLAVDVVYDAPPPQTERQNWARRLGLKLIAENDHDHLQPLGWTPD
jgi:murein endopeptidase